MASLAPQSSSPRTRRLPACVERSEQEIEQLYLSKRDTPDMKAMGRAFGRVSPARGGRCFAWVMDGATPDEQAAITRDVPAPVIKIIGGIFGRGYRKKVAPVWEEGSHPVG